ncbi:MAG: putative ABC transporter permease [Bacilli bacterium]
MKFINYLKKINKDEKKLNKKDTRQLCLFIFMFGGFIGFLAEEIFSIVVLKQFTKSGFLYGCFLPIYAWGCLLIFMLSLKFKKKPFILVFLIMLATGILEYCTGEAMLLIWGKRWWDYGSYFLNINGHVCLWSVSLFAIGGLLFTYIIEPLIRRLMTKIEPKKIDTICLSFSIIFIIDNILSFTFRNSI